MDLKEKPDAQEIRDFIERLKLEQWLGPSREWWPEFLYHFTDIQNAASILEEGQIVCRAELERRGTRFVDASSPEVMGQTLSTWKEYVRLYFRPRTPTQYRNEGFRPPERRQLGGAHCPVPVYFLFDSKSILCRADTLFSEGSLATGTQPFSDANGLKSIPFNQVYHDSWFDPRERPTVIFHRHAEVIVPNRLSLEHLRHVACRTPAEYQTLLSILSERAAKRWKKKIGLGIKQNLFFRHWTFVEQAILTDEAIEFKFNKDSKEPGPFQAMVRITEKPSNRIYTWSDGSYYATDKLVISLSSLEEPSNYMVSLHLNDQLAFSGRYDNERDEPY